MTDLTKTPHCRLCLQATDDVVNIRGKYRGSSIASILTKHFWFLVNKDDGLTEFICDVCWIQTETFHQFYKKVEQIQERFFDSVAKDKSADNEVDCADKVMETDVDIAVCEETELRPQAIDSQIGTSNDSEYDSGQSDFPDEAEESEVKGTECSKNGRENADAKSLPHVVEEEPRLLGLSSSERIELEGQIRDLFNMNCEICSNVTFGTISDARKHYRRVHQKAGYLMCCGKPFQYTYGIVQHLRHHINLDVNGTPDPEDEDEIREWFDMKCDICGDDNKVEFKALREVQRHFRKVHSMRGYLRSTCCNTKVRSRPNMLNHIRWHKNTGPWKCEECDITFRNKFRLTTHMANRHTPLDAREFNCTLCSSKFALAASLRSHVKNKHTSKTGEKFNCNKCTKSFRSKLLLSHHLRNTHESTIEYVCEMCARKFKSKAALKNHIDCFHLSKPPPKVQCDVCGVWLRRLHNHRLLHERGSSVNCPICNKSTPSKNALNSHMRTVHCEKRFKCQLCNKEFKLQIYLKEHLATHTGENLYSCPYCEKKFKSSGNMHKHRKNGHFDEWTRDAKQRTKRKMSNEQIEPDVSSNFSGPNLERSIVL